MVATNITWTHEGNTSWTHGPVRLTGIRRQAVAEVELHHHECYEASSYPLTWNCWYENRNLRHLLWMAEIMHHQKDGWNPNNNGINNLSTGAGFGNHPEYGWIIWLPHKVLRPMVDLPAKCGIIGRCRIWVQQWGSSLREFRRDTCSNGCG